MHELSPVLWPAATLIAATLLAWALTGLVLYLFSNARHASVPNERTMHKAPTPNVGGLAIMGAFLCLGALALAPSRAAWTLGGAVAVLAFVSWVDQYRPLWPLTRFFVQALTVASAMSLLPADFRLVPDIPSWLERTALGLAWMWMINLTNFIDGIDGIAATSGALTALGYAAVVSWPLHSVMTVAPSVTIAVVLAGACLGYLIWNWHPARIFMGDTGSIPLGFLLGWLLLDLASRGLWASALILHAPYVADTTVTLLKRLLRGEKIWQAHRTHFYQRAVMGGPTPAVVVRHIAAAHLILIALAVFARVAPILALIAAAAVTVWLLAHLTRLAKGNEHRVGV